MERDSKNRVRVREGDEDHNNASSSSSSEKHAKTKDDPNNYGNLYFKYSILEYNDNSSSTSSCCKISADSHLTLGVFDFPWLKDGIISISEDWINFEDVFSSPLALDNTPTSFATTPGHYCIESIDQFSMSGQCLFQTNQPDQALLLGIPEDKLLKEDVWHPQDVNQDDGFEGADDIWSSLLNQPLDQQLN